MDLAGSLMAFRNGLETPPCGSSLLPFQLARPALRTPFAVTYANSISYTPHGAMTSVTLGNSKVQTETFNSRLQPTQIAAGSLLTTVRPTTMGTPKAKRSLDPA